ncbi:MAG: proteasome-activating nucleotidase, partial [Promethearchaeota archaeon]
MESTPIDEGKKRDRDIKNEEYLSSYTQHLEKRLRNLETEIQLLENTRKKLEKDVIGLRDELTTLNEPYQITGTIIDILDDSNERIVIKCSTGPDYVVKVHKDKKKIKFSSGMEVSLNSRDYSILEILPSNIDPFIKGMELHENIPEVSYSDIGGLDEQILEIRETVELPLLKPELYSRIGIDPPKGVLLHG